MLVEQTLLQMVYDRGFNINELYDLAMGDPENFSLKFKSAFEKYNRVLFNNNFFETPNGISLAETFKNNYWRTTFFEIFKNDNNESCLVMIAPTSKSTKAIDKSQAIDIIQVLKIINPTQFILVIDKPKFDDLIYSYKPNATTIFLDIELTFNVTHHNYAVILRKATKEEEKNNIITLKKNLPKRIENDLICRYHGFKAGDIIIEEVEELSLPYSIITRESFPALVYKGKSNIFS